MDFEPRVANFGTEARASHIFLSSYPYSLIHIIRTPSLPFGGQSSNSRIIVESVPRTAAFVGATSGIGKATLARLVAMNAQIKAYVVGSMVQSSMLSPINSESQTTGRIQTFWRARYRSWLR